MSIHKSGWIVNFKNGSRVILSESAYKVHKKTTPMSVVESEEHWFMLKDAIRKNPDLKFIE